jgi:hypothetical protein
MVDYTTLIVASTIVQAAVITITLGVLVLQFRSQERSIREASYQGMIGRYNNFVTGVVQNPTVFRSFLGNNDISPEESLIYGNLLNVYGIIEEAFLLRAKNWISEDEWKQWSVVLSAILARPKMKAMLEGTRGSFDGRFEEYTARMFKEMEENASKKSIIE